MNAPYNEKVTSGRHISFWLFDESPDRSFKTLTSHLDTDVVVVGGGIAGLSVAYCALQSGLKVIVVEDGFIGSGETGHTTAHLTAALDDRYYHLQRVFGKEELPLIAGSHQQAINFIERTVNAENIECDFERLSGYLFLHPTDNAKSLQKEQEAATVAGLEVRLHEEVPGMLRSVGNCLEFPNQAQFHPLKYINGLCRAIEKMGGQIFTGTHAAEISSKGIKSSGGYSIRAQHVVVATNSPVNDKLVIHTKQYPYRTYVIGAKVPKGSIPSALWWDTGDHEQNSSIPPYHYVRLQKLDQEHDLLICGGEDHATGMADADKIPEENRYNLLEKWARNLFDMGEVTYRWSGQVMEPMDSLGFIGRNPMDKSNVYIVTGDSGNGLTHGTIAGMLITDLIQGKTNPWEKIYDPSRVKWFRAGNVFFSEFVLGFISYLRNKPDTDPEQIHELRKNEGKVLKWRGKTCGIYRDAGDLLHVVDASCTHLQCTVKWNNDEKSWDCPCHGSRFSHQGRVMNGPANRDLPYHSEKLNP